MVDNNNTFINSIQRGTVNPINRQSSPLEQSLLGLNGGRFSSSSRVNSNLAGRNSNSNNILRLFDLNSDKVVSNEELIDVALRKHFSDPNMASPYNSNAGDITRLVAKVDSDYNGQISDVELAKALLAERRGELGTLDPEIKNYLLNKNSNRQVVEAALNTFDAPDADHIIDDFEVLDKLTALKAAGTTISATTRTILGTNPHYYKIQQLLNDTNFGEINTPKEIFDFLLAARKFGVEDVFAARELSGNDAILNLVKKLDQDADGVISQKEFIASYVAITKKGNPDNIDANLFYNLISSQTSFSGIPSVIDPIQIDINGNINEVQAALLIAAAKNNSVNDPALVLNVIKELSSNGGNSQFRKLLELINANVTLSNQELVSLILASRNPEFSNIQSSTFDTLISIGGIITVDYKNAIASIDQNANGVIDNEEVSKALLRNKSGDTIYNETVLTDILSSNPKYAEIKQLIDIFDSTPNGQYSSEEIVKGLLTIRGLKLNADSTNLNIALDNNDLLKELPNLVKMFDADSSGTISEEEYTSVMVAIAKGTKPEIDTDLLNLIETQVPNAGIIKNAIEAFVNDFNRTLTPQELMNKFEPLVNNSNGEIDPTKLSIMTRIIGIIHPNANQLINLYLNFDNNHDDQFSTSETIKGLIQYNSAVSGVSRGSLYSIASQATDYAAIQYALTKIDTQADGELTNTELVSAFLKIKRGDFSNDPNFKYTESDQTGIVNQILANNPNFDLVNKVMSTFNYTPGFKPTNSDLAASVLVQNHLGIVSQADKDSFLAVLGLKTAELEQLTKISDEITKLENEASLNGSPSAFDPTSYKITTNLLMDKLILLSLGKIEANPALISLLRTNSSYEQMSKLFGKYSEKKKLTENSLVKMLIDANSQDPALKLNDDIKNYFTSLFKGKFDAGFLADYKASIPVSTPPVVLTNDQVKDRFKSEFLDAKLIAMNSSFDSNVATYTKAINILDPDHNGKLSNSDYSLHQYYFSSQFGKAQSVYDFDNNGIVDNQDRLIFDKVASYLKIN